MPNKNNMILKTSKKIVSEYMISKKESPHCLMELSLAEVRNLKENTIHLAGLTLESNVKKGPIIENYSDSKCGKGVSLVEQNLMLMSRR